MCFSHPMEQQTTLSRELVDAIDGLYPLFERYQLSDFESLGCYDFGPSTEELDALRHHSLRDVPAGVICSMEFFAHGWESWGSENEVKHFLPRILQLVAEDPSLLSSPGTASLFKYKLCGSVRPASIAPGPDACWSISECHGLRTWANEVIRHHLNNTADVLGLLEAVLEMGLKSEAILQSWSEVPQELRDKQMDSAWIPTYTEHAQVRAEASNVATWMTEQTSE